MRRRGRREGRLFWLWTNALKGHKGTRHRITRRLGGRFSEIFMSQGQIVSLSNSLKTALCISSHLQHLSQYPCTLVETPKSIKGIPNFSHSETALSSIMQERKWHQERQMQKIHQVQISLQYRKQVLLLKPHYSCWRWLKLH